MTVMLVILRDVMELATIHIGWQILCAESVGCGCRFVSRSQLVPAIVTTTIQLNY